MGLAAKYKRKSNQMFIRAERLEEKIRRLNFKKNITSNRRVQLFIDEKVRRLNVKVNNLRYKADELWETGDDIYRNAHM